MVAEGHLYIIDNYKMIGGKPGTWNDSGADTSSSAYEVVEIHPEEVTTLQTASSVMARQTTDAWLSKPASRNNPVAISGRLCTKCAHGESFSPTHHCHYFPFKEVTLAYRPRYHLRQVALEIFLANGEKYLVTLEEPKIRNELLQVLKQRCNESMTWVRGEVSNFQYLMHLNTLSGRSYNDMTQNPVFPWVLVDWDSEELDFSNPATFRDLTKPMGALNSAREMEFRERYSLLKEEEQQALKKSWLTFSGAAAYQGSFTNTQDLVRQLKLAPTKRPALDSVSDSMTLYIDELTETIVLTVGVSIYVYDANGSPLTYLNLSTLPLRKSPVGANNPDYNIRSRSLFSFPPTTDESSYEIMATNVLNSPATLISACSALGDDCSPLTLLTGHTDGQIRLWVLEYGREEREAMKENERYGMDCRLILIQELAYALSASGGVPSKAPNTALTLSQDLLRFYSGDTMGVVCAWDASSSAPYFGTLKRNHAHASAKWMK
ncbi:beach domain protein [Nannochloropsis oceanica]